MIYNVDERLINEMEAKIEQARTDRLQAHRRGWAAEEHTQHGKLLAYRWMRRKLFHVPTSEAGT